MIFDWQKDAYENGLKAFDNSKTEENCPYKHPECLLRAA
jgi:hypothetical protein